MGFDSERWWWRLRRLVLAISIPTCFLSVLLGFFSLWIGAVSIFQVFLGLFLLMAGCVVVGFQRTHRALWTAAGMVVIGFVMGFAPLLPFHSPSSTERPIISRSLSKEGPISPWFQGLPEWEIVQFGANLGLANNEGYLISKLETEYLELAKTPLFQNDHSVVLDSFFTDRQHYWITVPKGIGPFPLFIFLHGNGGNFQVYPAWLSRESLKHQVITVLPTNGFGVWQQPGASDKVFQVIKDVQNHYSVDKKRIVLGGLSAGSIAAFEIIQARPNLFAGLVAISGGPNSDLNMQAFRKVPVLAFHGARDPRVPVENIRGALKALKKAGQRTTYHEFPAGDHFILFNERNVIVPEIFNWVNRLDWE